MIEAAIIAALFGSLVLVVAAQISPKLAHVRTFSIWLCAILWTLFFGLPMLVYGTALLVCPA